MHMHHDAMCCCGPDVAAYNAELYIEHFTTSKLLSGWHDGIKGMFCNVWIPADIAVWFFPDPVSSKDIDAPPCMPKLMKDSIPDVLLFRSASCCCNAVAFIPWLQIALACLIGSM